MTLSYDLCLKLKESGFNQGMNDGDRYWGDDKKHVADWCAHYPYPDPDATPSSLVAKIPSLTELIEACGERLDGLIRVGHSGGGVNMQWLATAGSCEECGRPDSYMISGPTREEAVANLYLSLNPKP